MDFIDQEGNPHPNNEQIISELLKMDYIETGNDKNIYFLTTTGYDCVEGLKRKETNTIQESKEIQLDSLTELIHNFGTKKFKKYIFIWLFLFGIFVTVFKYFFPNSFQKDKPKIEVILNDEMIDDIKNQTQQEIDSIKNK